MELSTELYVTDFGLERIIFDSHLREDIYIPIYGVHQSDWPIKMFLWNHTKGAPKSVTDAWLRTEDGQQFLKDMEREDFNFDLNELDGPPSDEE
jgi:hypothetical protein